MSQSNLWHFQKSVVSYRHRRMDFSPYDGHRWQGGCSVVLYQRSSCFCSAYCLAFKHFSHQQISPLVWLIVFTLPLLMISSSLRGSLNPHRGPRMRRCVIELYLTFSLLTQPLWLQFEHSDEKFICSSASIISHHKFFRIIISEKCCCQVRVSSVVPLALWLMSAGR